MLKISNVKKSVHSILNPIYILCAALFLIILLGIVNSPLVAHAKTIDKMNIAQSADSYLYYMALTDCITNNELSWARGSNIIAETDANKLNWFGVNNSDPNDGDVYNPTTYTPAKPGNQIVDTLHCRGAPSNLIEKALSAWGYTDGVEALCAFGLKRRTIIVNNGTTGSKPSGGEEVDCITGSSGQDEFYTTESNKKINLGTFQAAVKKKVYNGDGRTDISFTDPIAYHIYRQALYTGCLGTDTVKNPDLKPTPSTDGIEPSRDNNYIKIKDVDTAGIEKEIIYKLEDKSKKVIFYTNPRGWTTMSCSELAFKLKDGSLAKAYSDKLKENLKDTSIDKEGTATGTGESTGEKPTCGSQIKLLGWIICSIIEGLVGLNDMMFKLIESLLVINPLTQDATDNTFIAWGSMRNLANAAFVIAFLIIIFSQMSGAGITNYGIKKLLPKLIICAILVNLSYLIMQVLVDIANITGSSIYGILKSLTPDTKNFSWLALYNLSIAGSLGSAGILIGGTTMGAAAMLWLLLPIIIMGTLAFIAAFATLVFRQAAIPILAILSPLAFVAYLLPNTESWFKKWKDTFTSMLVLYPTAALLFGGCYFVSHSMIGDGSDWWKLMMGLVIMVLPLFSLPFIAKQGGAILSKVNGALSGAADKFKKPVSSWTGKNAERASEASKNRAMSSNRPSLRRSYLRRQAKLDDIKKGQSENYKYEQARYIAGETENNADYRRRVARGSGEAGEQRALVNAIKIQNSLEADEITASKVLFKHAGLSSDAKQELAMTGSHTTANGTTYSGRAMQDAAIQEQMATGKVEQMYEIIESTHKEDDSGNTGALYEFRQTVASAAQANGLSKKDAALGGSRLELIGQGLIGGAGSTIGGNDISFSARTLKAAADGKYTPEALAGMDNDARDRVIVLAKAAAAAGNTAALENLKASATTVQASLDLRGKLEGIIATNHIDDLVSTPVNTGNQNTGGGGI